MTTREVFEKGTETFNAHDIKGFAEVLADDVADLAADRDHRLEADALEVGYQGLDADHLERTPRRCRSIRRTSG